jgi:hypothetical protein
MATYALFDADGTSHLLSTTETILIGRAAVLVPAHKNNISRHQFSALLLPDHTLRVTSLGPNPTLIRWHQSAGKGRSTLLYNAERTPPEKLMKAGPGATAQAPPDPHPHPRRATPTEGGSSCMHYSCEC